MQTTRVTFISALLLASLAAPAGVTVAADDSATSVATAGDWPMFKGDAGRAGAALDGPDGDPIIRWQYEAGMQITGNVSVVGDLALASSDDGVLHALDVTTGAVRWRHAPGASVSQPTVFEGSIFVYEDGNDLVSLSLSGGDVEWRVPDVVRGPTYPTAGDGMLFIGTDDGSLVAIDAATGQERWRTQISDASGPTHRPAFADGRIYVASDGGGFVAVEADDGSIAWRFDTGLGGLHLVAISIE
jgi:outer membrane protein assembly factor BamB